jgi:hypothetical protein
MNCRSWEESEVTKGRLIEESYVEAVIERLQNVGCRDLGRRWREMASTGVTGRDRWKQNKVFDKSEV